MTIDLAGLTDALLAAAREIETLTAAPHQAGI
jgi:hypothetical protein